MLELRLNNTSRMSREAHVRFCERLRGETPLCLLGAKQLFKTKISKGIDIFFHIIHVLKIAIL